MVLPGALAAGGAFADPGHRNEGARKGHHSRSCETPAWFQLATPTTSAQLNLTGLPFGEVVGGAVDLGTEVDLGIEAGSAESSEGS